MRDLTPNVCDCALAFEGGGYRETFSAGIATVLMDVGIRFGYVCGVSAGSSNTVDYVSDDKFRVREAFMMHEAAREATGLRSLARGHGYFDADALYEDAVTLGTLPFDYETFMANPADVRIQAFQRDTGCTLRFGKEGMTDRVRLMDIVRASSTLPGAMRPRPVDGHVLYDGARARAFPSAWPRRTVTRGPSLWPRARAATASRPQPPPSSAPTSAWPETTPTC